MWYTNKARVYEILVIYIYVSQCETSMNYNVTIYNLDTYKTLPWCLVNFTSGITLHRNTASKKKMFVIFLEEKNLCLS